MKLSNLKRAMQLANERANLLHLLESIEIGEDVEVSIGGWPADVTDGVANRIADEAAEFAQSELDRVEQALGSLGVAIDVPRVDPSCDGEDYEDGAVRADAPQPTDTDRSAAT